MTRKTENRILVVDDDESVINILRRLLKKRGFSNIMSALDAEQALHIMETADSGFSLVISDQAMPGMKGSELLKKVRAMYPYTRRILMTGYQNFKVAVEAVNEGAIHQYISKPWENEELLAKIRNELDLYEKFIERERFLRLTRRQNSKLFKMAKAEKEKDRKLTSEIKKKKEKKEELAGKAKELETKKPFEKPVFELYSLISKNIVIQGESLARTFWIIKDEVDDLIGTICNKKGFSLPEQARKPFTGTDTDEPYSRKQDMYEPVDLILQYAGMNAEPQLYAYGKELLKEFSTEHYTRVPAIGDLALSEGYITKEDLDRASIELATRAKEEPGVTMERILSEKGLISRLELSRLYIKSRLISIRIRDTLAANELHAKGLVSEKEITGALIKQVNLFLERGTCVSAGDLLAEKGIIDEKTRQALFTDREKDEATARTSDRAEKRAENAETEESRFGFHVSDDLTEASISPDMEERKAASALEVIDFLKEQGVRHGIVDENLIHGFLTYEKEADKKLIVAIGRKPVEGKDACITYHFNTDYQRPGVIADDGSIDFRERGDVPFVQKDVLLAEKTPMEQGHSGLDIFGETIPCREVYDRSLSCGAGTILSDNGLKLYSAIEGQPALDALGVVSVHKELAIKGDVSFKTGHIDYEGNVNVSGTVKEGFRVTCVDLTANGITGGIIETSGDLNVSEGIVNATVKVQGNIRAKYVQDSVIEVFGEISATREIMESDIVCGSRVLNENGKIIASSVAAKKGMILGQVGTEKSGASTLKTGIDEYIKKLSAGFDLKIKAKEEKVLEYEKQKKKIEGKIFDLHKQAADLSFAHESVKREVDALKEQFSGLKGQKDRMIELKKKIKAREEVMEQHDADVKSIFKSQDILMKDVEEQEQRIEKTAAQADEIRTEKEALEEIAALEKPEPFIKITKRATSGTHIYGPRTSMVVRYDLRPCKIIEIESTDPDDTENRKLVTQNL
ncbi:MAG: flagellar assembly protein A [Thermodesulfobacteriota bacterium]